MPNFYLPLTRRHPRASLWTALLSFMLISVVLAPSGTTSADTRPQEIPASYELMEENDQFQLYIDPTTLAFKVMDKRSNYLWHSGLDELLEEDRLNSSWEAFARSGISIEYLDAKAVNKRVSISNTEHTMEITNVEQGISAQITFPEYDISVGVMLQLEADGVRVEIPFETIREGNPNFRLGRVYVYPFLGAVRGSTIPGYMLVPDGTGSLIPFGDTTKAANMSIGRYYGPDLGMIAEMSYDPLVTFPFPITVPVFGITHEEGKNAFVSVVEKGASYGELQVHPAGIITNFNFIHNAFLYHEAYFQATNRSGAGVTTVQANANVYDAIVHYRFLTGADANYVGMARSYQQYLVDKGLLHTEETANANIGIRLEFLGGDKERVLLWNRFVPMTTLQQVSDILAGLQLPNPEVIYYGWQPSGASSMPATSLALDGGLGSIGDLQSVVDTVSANGGHFSLYLDPLAALYQEPGYSPRNDLAMAITNINLEGYSRYPTYYFNLDALRPRYTELTQNIASQVGTGLALDSIGYTAYSDFRNGQQLNREDSIAAYQTLLAESPQRLGFYRPNDYMFGVASAYYDMPMADNSYVYTSEAVPFLPIVLAGHLPYYGTTLNFSSNRQDDLLRLVEYGIYPSYFLTQEATANMLNTPSAWIYTSSYDQWGDEIRQTYQWMNSLLGPVAGQEIVAHEELAAGVFTTTYANGRQIIVNYNDIGFEHFGVSVEPRNAVLVENSL